MAPRVELGWGIHILHGAAALLISISTRCSAILSHRHFWRRYCLHQGFVYLVAVIDWFSRYVLSWALSVTLDGQFCRDALTQALCQGRRPEIFNTDQGVQFTSKDFTQLLAHEGIRISMDGRGRALDHVFVERLWRTVKYEEVYLKDYTTVREARQSLGEYFTFYNHERLHQALGYQTPAAVYH